MAFSAEPDCDSILVMPGLVPGIHVLAATKKDVDARDICAKTRFAL
jgi:hypothetical protein